MAGSAKLVGTVVAEDPLQGIAVKESIGCIGEESRIARSGTSYCIVVRGFALLYLLESLIREIRDFAQLIHQSEVLTPVLAAVGIIGFHTCQELELMFACVKGILIAKGCTEVFAREEAFALLADTPFG